VDLLLNRLRTITLMRYRPVLLNRTLGRHDDPGTATGTQCVAHAWPGAVILLTTHAHSAYARSTSEPLSARLTRVPTKACKHTRSMIAQPRPTRVSFRLVGAPHVPY